MIHRFFALMDRVNAWLETRPSWLGALLFILFGLLFTVIWPAVVEGLLP